jgi:hypothetical protein
MNTALHQFGSTGTITSTRYPSRLVALCLLGVLLLASSGLGLALHHTAEDADHPTHHCDLCAKLTTHSTAICETPQGLWLPVEMVCLAGPQTETTLLARQMDGPSAPRGPPAV